MNIKPQSHRFWKLLQTHNTRCIIHKVKFKHMKIAYQTKRSVYFILGITFFWSKLVFVMTARHNKFCYEPSLKSNQEVATPSAFYAFTTFLSQLDTASKQQTGTDRGTVGMRLKIIEKDNWSSLSIFLINWKIKVLLLYFIYNKYHLSTNTAFSATCP